MGLRTECDCKLFLVVVGRHDVEIGNVLHLDGFLQMMADGLIVVCEVKITCDKIRLPRDSVAVVFGLIVIESLMNEQDIVQHLRSERGLGINLEQCEWLF